MFVVLFTQNELLHCMLNQFGRTHNLRIIHFDILKQLSLRIQSAVLPGNCTVYVN